MPDKRAASVLAACNPCRIRKTRCDGQRPICATCIKRAVACVYNVDRNETQRQNKERTRVENGKYRQLVEAVVAADDATATILFERLRAGEPLGDLVTSLDRSTLWQRTAPLPQHDQRQFQGLLLILVTSNISFRELAQVANIYLPSSSRADFPAASTYRPFRDPVVSIETINNFLAMPKSSQPALSRSSTAEEPEGGADETGDASGIRFGQALYQITDQSWVAALSDSALASLVSTFLTLVNPYWEVLDAELFLHDMQRQDRHRSLHCSRALVHAMLACASLFSEVDEAFLYSTDVLTRGLHFHDEALRLWIEDGLEEEDGMSLTSIQTALALAISAYIRGKDRQGVRWAHKAASLNRRIPLSDGQPNDPGERTSYIRARAYTASSVIWLNLTYASSLMQRIEHLKVRLSEIPDLETLPSSPSAKSSLSHEMKPMGHEDSLMRARNELMPFMWSIIALYSRQDLHTAAHEILREAQGLSAQMQSWHDGLPADLCFNEKEAVTRPVIALQGQYNYLSLMLYDWIYRPIAAVLSEDTSLLSDSDRVKAKDLPNEVRKAKIFYCYKVEICLRKQREVFGLKATTGFALQQAVLAGSILLVDVDRHPLDATTISADHPTSPDAVPTDNATHDQRQVAFEECFRIMISDGMQRTLARGLVKCLCFQAQQQRFRLTRDVNAVLDMLRRNDWQVSDLQHLSSTHPSYFYPDKAIDDDEHRIEALLRRMGRLELDVPPLED